MFCKHQYGFYHAELSSCSFPEFWLEWYEDDPPWNHLPESYPESHCIYHVILKTLLWPVKLDHICPVGSQRRSELPGWVPFVELRMINGELIIPRCIFVPSHALHTSQVHALCLLSFQNPECFRFGFYIHKVFNRIITAKRFLPVNNTNRICGLWHNNNTQIFQAGKVFCKCVESSFFSELSDVTSYSTIFFDHSGWLTSETNGLISFFLPKSEHPAIVMNYCSNIAIRRKSVFP